MQLYTEIKNFHFNECDKQDTNENLSAIDINAKNNNHKKGVFETKVSYEPCNEKTCLREFPTRSDSNWPAQLQKLA